LSPAPIVLVGDFVSYPRILANLPSPIGFVLTSFSAIDYLKDFLVVGDFDEGLPVLATGII
jgi:hypothetical protein